VTDWQEASNTTRICSTPRRRSTWPRISPSCCAASPAPPGCRACRSRSCPCSRRRSGSRSWWSGTTRRSNTRAAPSSMSWSRRRRRGRPGTWRRWSEGAKGSR